MSLYVRIENDEVKDVWDTPPQEGVGVNGWRNAIEVRPEIVQYRQAYSGHTFDLSKDPVEIVYGTFDISVDDRKESMKQQAAHRFQNAVREQVQLQLSENPSEQYDAAAVETARQAMLDKQAAVQACTTHDELDALLG